MSFVTILSAHDHAPLTISRSCLSLAATLLIVLAACAPTGRRQVVTIEDTTLNEISGIAVSHMHPDVLWALEDSGSPASLVAIDMQGRRRAALGIDGAENIDWEDLTAFDWQGQRHLLVSDVGDNNAVRPRVRLWAVAEPQTLADQTVSPAWSTDLVWPDGPRDCEAVAVDTARREILLITKRALPPALYLATLPERPTGIATADAPPLRAAFAAHLFGVPVAPEAAIRADHRAAWRHQPTAAALSPDGRQLAVLTYTEVLFYDRRGDESWAAAVARAPRILPLPALKQAEAITWSSDGARIVVSGEKTPTPIHVLHVPAQRAPSR